MRNRVERKNLDILLSRGKRLSRNEISELLDVSDNIARVYQGIIDNYEVLTNTVSDEKRVLVVGDLHEPFTIDGYLEFCLSIKRKYACNETIFIGDIIDNHASSYHESDVDGDSAGLELKKSEERIQAWYKAFPKAKVCGGNHDLIPIRKAQTLGLSSRWIKALPDLLNTPNWTFSEDFVIDGVLYTHGMGRQARQRSKNDMMSIVQGHWHSKSYIEHFVGLSDHIWAMQVGCGVDRKTYAMAYGKHFDKQHINCGVVLENGKLPILEYMNL